MPNTPPRKPARQVPSGERIKQMLIPSMMGSMPASAPDSDTPEHLMEYVMRQYPYAPQQFTAEERQAYADLLARNERSLSPARTDVPADFYDKPFNFDRGDLYYIPKSFRRGGELRPTLDSVYTASRIKEADTAMKNADLSEFARRVLNVLPGSRVSSRNPY